MCLLFKNSQLVYLKVLTAQKSPVSSGQWGRASLFTRQTNYSTDVSPSGHHKVQCQVITFPKPLFEENFSQSLCVDSRHSDMKLIKIETDLDNTMLRQMCFFCVLFLLYQYFTHICIPVSHDEAGSILRGGIVNKQQTWRLRGC